uniref:Uncharacterized protein n=1 Tax=Avena sativa TaxID=4498 RepID=A0ACD5VQ07_AVESA
MPSDGDGSDSEAETAESRSLEPAWGECPQLYLSYGIASLQGTLPELTDALAALPSFTTLSPPFGLDYFGVFDGHFGAAVANHLTERLHGAIAEQIEDELVSPAPRFLHGSRGDVGGWWRTALADAFRAVDEEVLMSGSAAAVVGATALVALVLKEYLVLANCGVSRAVISRGGEAVQLTAEHRPNRPDEKRRVENAGGRVDESTNTVDGVLPTSRAFGSSLYKQYVTAEPEVTAVARDPRDEFLILATAGLWDHVSPAAACRFVERKLRSRSRAVTPCRPAGGSCAHGGPAPSTGPTSGTPERASSTGRSPAFAYSRLAFMVTVEVVSRRNHVVPLSIKPSFSSPVPNFSELKSLDLYVLSVN